MIIKSKITSNIPVCQQKHIINPYNPRPSQEIIKNVDKVIEAEYNSTQQVLEYLVRYRYKYPSLYMAQQTIADEIGLSRKTVNIAIKTLDQYGFISKFYRHMNTSHYRVSDIFFRIDIRQKLKHLFPVLEMTLFMFSLLLSPSPLQASVKACNTKDKVVNISSSLVYYLTTTYLLSEPHFVRNQPYEVTHRRYKPKKDIMSNEALLKSLGFTDIQIQLLSSYPSATITYAAQQMKRVTGIKSPFKYFEGICKNHQSRGPSPSKGGSGSVVVSSRRDRTDEEFFAEMDEAKYQRLLSADWSDLSYGEKSNRKLLHELLQRKPEGYCPRVEDIKIPIKVRNDDIDLAFSVPAAPRKPEIYDSDYTIWEALD